MHMILKRSNKNKYKLSNKIKKIKINKAMKVLRLMIHKLQLNKKKKNKRIKHRYHKKNF